MIFGTTHRRRLEGHVADFCLLCRALRPFRIERIVLRPHVLGLPVGPRRHGGHLACCLHCGSTVAPDLERFERLWPTRAALEVLLRETHPDARDRYRQRLQVEATVAQSPRELPPSLREELIAQALVAVNHEVHQRTSWLMVDREVVFAVLACAAVALWVLPALVSAGQARADAEFVFLAAAAGLVACLMSTADLRYLRREIYPKVSDSLRPLDPTRIEIEHALHRLLQRRFKVGALVKPKTLLGWISRQHAPAG